VESVIFREHRKEGSPPSFRIDYCTSFATYSHWLAIDSEKARSMAQGFWKRHSLSGTPPENVREALMRTPDLRVPGRIQVMREGKFNRIVHWDYTIPPGKVIPTTRELPSSKRRLFGPYQKIGVRA
jgi:hypothetical protein